MIDRIRAALARDAAPEALAAGFAAYQTIATALVPADKQAAALALAMNAAFASHLVMRGAPVKAGHELLGHATIMMTMRYAHLAPEIARERGR